MAQVIVEQNTKQKRTVMYSVERVQVIGKDKSRNIEEQVVVHKLPYDADSRLGMEKLQRFIKKGYTFEDPRKVSDVGRVASIPPESVVEPEMIISEVEIIEEEAPAPLYVSDKPEKPKAKKRKSRTKK